MHVLGQIAWYKSTCSQHAPSSLKFIKYAWHVVHAIHTMHASLLKLLSASAVYAGSSEHTACHVNSMHLRCVLALLLATG